jgi:hypothetical protein
MQCAQQIIAELPASEGATDLQTTAPAMGGGGMGGGDAAETPAADPATPAPPGAADGNQQMGRMGGMISEQMSGKIARMSAISHPIGCPYLYTVPRETNLTVHRCFQP